MRFRLVYGKLTYFPECKFGRSHNVPLCDLCWYLKAGIEIFEFQPTMYHCKVMVVDGLWTSVGSTNFDSRSFRLNDEANLNILDAEFARRETENFAQDKLRSKQITLAEWNSRPLSEKATEFVAGLLRSQL